MKLLIALHAHLAASAPSGLPPDFVAWAQEHGRQYRTQYAWEHALNNYKSNSDVIESLNKDSEDGASYDHSPFSDLSPSQFRQQYFPAPMDPVLGRQGAEEVTISTGTSPQPEAVDWRSLGAVTPVKDQSACGSCWAESAVSNVESQWYLAHKSSMSAAVSLSVEQVIECDTHDYACYGGYPKGAYQYIIEHGGIASDADYKYAVNGHTICLANQTYNATCGDGMCDDPPLTSYCDVTCSDKKHKSVAKLSSWVALPSSEDQMVAFLASKGPISIAIDASGGAIGILFPWLQFYHHGVANPRRCTNKIDHGVLIVGYGEEKGTKYWIIKNSWGAKWGEEGYFRLIRGTARCGITTMATSAVVAAATDAASSLVV